MLKAFTTLYVEPMVTKCIPPSFRGDTDIHYCEDENIVLCAPMTSNNKIENLLLIMVPAR